MGDGAVVCMPLAERFAVSETSWSGRVFGRAPGKEMKDLEKGEKSKEPEEIFAKGELENGEFAQEQGEPERNGELENGEFVPDSGHMVELEMGEFVPEEWGKLEEIKVEQKPESSRISELDREERRLDRQKSREDHHRRRERDRRGDRRGRTPENYHRRKEDRRRIDSEERKRGGKEVNTDTDSHKHETTNGKHHGRDCSTIIQKKHHGDSEGTSASKIRRISGDNLHNSSSISSRISSSSRYSSSRRHDSPLPSRAHDRYTKSHHDHSHHHNHRDRTPSYRDRSSRDRSRYNDHREKKTPANSDRSPQNSVRRHDGSDKRHGRHEEKPRRRESDAKDSPIHSSTRPEKDRTSQKSVSQSRELLPPPPQISTPLPTPLPVQENGFLEYHHLSMEEDMDICDTPPHSSNRTEDNSGKWYYLDEFGLEQGPAKLSDLKRLVEEGALSSDHLIKHFDSDRWVTVENAASPLISVNSSSIVSDAVTRMVSPPEAPGNTSIDGADIVMEKSMLTFQPENNWNCIEPPGGFCIDERVEALLDGREIIPGEEIESIGKALKASFEHIEWENWGQSEGFTRSRGYALEIPRFLREDGTNKHHDGFAPTLDKDPSFSSSDSTDLFAGRWSCKGGDWKRNDDIMIERCQKRKLVLNEGFPLCQMPKSGDDPRQQLKDELYYSSFDKKLDLPTWAFTCIDDKNDIGGDSTKSRIQIKNPAIRGVKGMMLPVVRINACVAKDRAFSPEPRLKVKPARSSRSLSVGSDKNPGVDITPQIKKGMPQSNAGSIKNHKDRIRTVDELSLDNGGWFYLDGKGREHGPFLYSELQELVSKGTILKNSSVFRKVDNIWIPVTNSYKDERRQKSKRPTSDSVPPNRTNDVSLNKLYPQFIGYTRGKLHELVMKSYKSREFAAAIHEVLDPWISTKQPKKETERHFPFNSSITKSSVVLSHDAPTERFWSTDADGSGSYGHTGKRTRLLLDDSEEDQELEDHSFEDLWGVRDVADEMSSESFSAEDSWGMLNNNILARVFHFLRADVKSLSFSAATCKHWRAAVQSYKDISKRVDLSSLGSSCTDSMLKSIMCGYNKSKISSLSLSKCTLISVFTLEEILHSFTNIASIDIRSCSQFKELTDSFQNIQWIRNRSSQNIKSLKWITDKSLTPSRSLKEVNGDELASSKDAVVPTFRQGFYKRTRLPDARKSSSASTRHAQLRQLLRKKSVTAYRKMEEFIRTRLKEIMKGNSFELFASRVAEIEDKMRSGHYERHGLSSIKEDISRMCRDALKVKKKGDSGEMRNVIMLFVQLAKRLEDSKSITHKKDESSKSFRDKLDAGLSEGSRHKKKSSNRLASDKKGSGKSQRSTNGGLDHESTAIDREVKKSLAKLKRRHTYSDSDTSEENDLYDTVTDSDGKTSDTDGEPENLLEKSTEEAKESTFTWDDSLDDREWGARMTKASLVPPVTRKYEVIDRYLIVADEELVKRKMSVSLPEDYEEKLQAQKNGLDETDMQIPEVKDYKPRKMLGVEVIEQEVYGIDPYTHNLLLDSMPDDADWLLVDKQNFIEEVLLRVLNKQTRHLTGSGNTPMVYHLKSVVEEIKKNAEEDGDSRLVKLSNSILKAMQIRPDDNYVAYRKGLGVVCNKDGGFGDDDFVVEFLGEVYPAWKWFEKQDGIRSLQKNNKDPAPEFYNIYLERPKGDRDGYDLVVVDAMHKANYASRICHSCRPNCEAKVTAVDGQYMIGIYAVRPIAYGEEITFDYNSVTESKEEYEASVCLCGSQVCRGSYLNLTGEDAFHNVLRDCHGLLDRHKLMLESCEANFVSQEDYMDLGRAGLGTCLLDGLPDWLIAYSARLVRFMNFERTKLPEEILKHNLEEKRKFFSDICIETEKIEAENQAEGVYNQRLQNLALTLDKVRYVMRCAFGDPKRAPPPLERLSPEKLVAEIWTGEESLVVELLRCLDRYLQSSTMDELRSKVLSHTPSGSDLASELKKSLLWLRDELRTIPCMQRCRNDAIADLLHLYAHTKCFFHTREYKVVRSPPVYISPLDLGPKYVEKMGAGFQEYCKEYGENYCLGQLIFWHNQTSAEPDSALVRARRGCLLLPDLSSFFPTDSAPPLYGPRTVRFMLSRMEKQPQRPWPKDQIWQFRSSQRLLGSPMLDAVLAGGHPLDKDMIHWLKTRSSLYDLS